MALFTVYGTRKVVSYEECTTEVEAVDKAAAIAAAEDEHAEGNLDWRGDHTDADNEEPTWAATELPASAHS